MIFFLQLQMGFKFVLFLMNALIYVSDDDIEFHPAVYTIIPLMPVLCLTMAALLNLYNWVFYYFKVGEMAS